MRFVLVFCLCILFVVCIGCSASVTHDGAEKLVINLANLPENAAPILDFPLGSEDVAERGMNGCKTLCSRLFGESVRQLKACNDYCKCAYQNGKRVFPLWGDVVRCGNVWIEAVR